MSEQQEHSHQSTVQRKPVVVDDDYLADIAKRLRMLRSLVKETESRLG